VLKVADPSKVVIVFDHLVPAPTAQAAECMQTGRAFAREFGIERLHDVGPDQGISHAVIADKAYALPGTVLVNADSHTCSAGAFNCAARGVGGPDMLYAVTTGKAWFKVGETIRYGRARQSEHRIRRLRYGRHEPERAPHADHDGHRAVSRVRHLRTR
jgi:3-isopropylmalate/(R)-2-methylmalate dehydratase large subunit